MSTPPDLGPLPEPVAHVHSDGHLCQDKAFNNTGWPVYFMTPEQVEAERQRCYMLGVAAERERCAKLCEDISDDYQRREGHRYPELRSDAESGANNCAEAIRAIPSAPTKEGG